MTSLDELYQEIILDHNRRPRNFGPLTKASHSARGENPLCGDEADVHLRIAGDHILEAGFSGQGCAISLASASMMTEAIRGKTLAETRMLATRVLAALRGQGIGMDLQKDGELASLAGVRKFPARVKCATLPWQALLAALDGGGKSVSTESRDS